MSQVNNNYRKIIQQNSQNKRNEKNNSISNSFFFQVPHVVNKFMVQYLGPNDLINLSKSGLYFKKICEDNKLWSNFLKPKQEIKPELTTQNILKSKEIYKKPENRLDKYVPIDKAGMSYLQSLGVNYDKYTIDLIQSGKITIQKLLDNKYLLNLKHIKKYIDNGKLKVTEVIGRDPIEFEALNLDYVQKYIDNEKLDIAYVIGSSVSLFYNLRSEHVQKYIDNGMLNINAVVGRDFSEFSELNLEHVQKYLDNGKLKINQVVGQDNYGKFEVLNLSHVQKYIDNGMLNIFRVIGYNNYHVFKDMNDEGILKFIDDNK